MENSQHNAPLVNPISWVVWAIFLPILAIEIVLFLADHDLLGNPQSIGWRLESAQRFGFWPEHMRHLIETKKYSSESFLRLISYSLISVNATQAIFVMIFVLALGKIVAERISWWVVPILFFCSSIMAALAYMAVLPSESQPLIGGFPAAYGLIGGFTYVTWLQRSHEGGNRYSAFRLIGFLMGIQILFSLTLGTGSAWIADAFGFICGFLLSVMLHPENIKSFISKIRER